MWLPYGGEQDPREWFLNKILRLDVGMSGDKSQDLHCKPFLV